MSKIKSIGKKTNFNLLILTVHSGSILVHTRITVSVLFVRDPQIRIILAPWTRTQQPPPARPCQIGTQQLLGVTLTPEWRWRSTPSAGPSTTSVSALRKPIITWNRRSSQPAPKANTNGSCEFIPKDGAKTAINTSQHICIWSRLIGLDFQSDASFVS